ncbi:MAG TPA: hypothetical protein VNO52_11040 [Methylomirabilota bacterium]|nr:hypothetical protein [Methylomirabilota bacterium]
MIPRALIVGWLLALAACGRPRAAEVRIDFIDRVGTNAVRIHFGTEAGRKYTLQYHDAYLAGNSTSGLWRTLFVAPNLPFPSHYVATDVTTNRHRVYRLRVTP